MNGNIGAVALLAFLVFFAGLTCGADSPKARRMAASEWRECRTLLTTQDSTAVLAARPACAQWTWPPKEGTTR